MLERLFKVCAYLTVVLGVVHISFTRFNNGRLTVGALWFIGSGVAVVLMGFLNLVLLRDAGKDALVRALCLIANVVSTLLFAVAIFVLAEPPAYIGFALLSFQTIAAFMLGGRTRDTQ